MTGMEDLLRQFIHNQQQIQQAPAPPVQHKAVAYEGIHSPPVTVEFNHLVLSPMSPQITNNGISAGLPPLQ